MKARRTNKRTLFRAVVLLFSLAAALAAIELYIRYIGTAAYIDPRYIKDEGVKYAPSIFSRHVLSPEERHVKSPRGRDYFINSKGYRGRDFAADKPAGAIRVIVYGGSAVFDPEMSGDEDWPHKAGAILKDEFSSIEVINAGVPGHASFDSAGRLFAEGHLFDPDYVVLYNAWNDIKHFGSDEPLLRIIKPRCKWDDPRLRYHNVVDRFLGENFKSYLLLRDYYYISHLRIGKEGIKPEKRVVRRLSENALRQFDLNVRMFADLAANIGAEPVLMTQARLVSPDNTEKEKESIRYDWTRLSHALLCEAFGQTDEIIRRAAQDKDASLIDASALLTGRPEFFSDHVHLSEKGSGELARLFARRMAQIIKEHDKNSGMDGH